MYQEHFRSAVKAELRRQGLTQTRLAATIGWSPQQLSDTLRGRHAMSVESAYLIASGLGVGLIDLLPNRYDPRGDGP